MIKITEIPNGDKYINMWRYGQTLYRYPYTTGLGHSIVLVIVNEHGKAIASTDKSLTPNNVISERDRDYIREFYNKNKKFPVCELIGDYLVINPSSKMKDLKKINL